MPDTHASLLIRTSAVVFLILLIVLGTTAAGEIGNERVVVKLRSNSEVEEFLEQNRLELIDSIPGTSLFLVEGSRSAVIHAQANPQVLSVEPDLPVELSETAILDPATVALLNPATVALLNTIELTTCGRNLVKASLVKQPALGRIQADNAKRVADGSLVTVAVLDTGIDGNHPALAGSILPGLNFIDGSSNVSEFTDLQPAAAASVFVQGAAALNPAVVALLNPSTVALLNPSTVALLNPATVALLNSPRSLYFGHGTLVSGLIRAIAPGALIRPLKVFDASGRSTGFRVAKGIRYAADMNDAVMNLSFEIQGRSVLVAQALDYAAERGVVLIASAGNRNAYITDSLPASHPRVIGVAATTLNDHRAAFSNYGPAVAVAAPGEGLVSTYPAGLYAVVSGTSFSSGIVSGEAALIRSALPLSAAQISTKIRTAVDSLQSGERPLLLGSGRIDLERAVRPR